jgi:hypothetical protein
MRMGKRTLLRNILIFVLGLAFLAPTSPANATIANKATVSATIAPVSNSGYVAFDLGAGQNLDNYTRWWCVSIDNSVPTSASAYLRPWTPTDYRDNISSSWGDTSRGETFGQDRCWNSSFYSFSSAGVLINLSSLASGDHNLKISVRGCGDEFIRCDLSSTEPASNVVSKTIAKTIAKLVVDQANSFSQYDQSSEAYYLSEFVKKSPDISEVYMKSWCLQVDGQNFTRELASPASVVNWLQLDASWVDGCVQIPNRGIDDTSDYHMVISIDAFKIGLGAHTFGFKAELQNGESISFERVITGTGSVAPRTSELNAEQRDHDLHLNLEIAWPMDIPASADVEWFVDDASLGKNVVNTAATYADKVISPALVSAGTHGITAKLTTSDGSLVVKQTSVDIDNRPATLTFSPSLNKTYKTGSTVAISGSFLDAVGFEPNSAKIRTKQYGKAWSAWKSIRVTGGLLTLSQKIILNTTVQVSAVSKWDGTTYLSQTTINVAPIVFKYTQTAKRTKLKQFLQGAIVTYKVTTDKAYSGTCVMLLKTDYAFNFALVELGAELKYGYIKVKNGVGSGTVTVKFNGIYDSGILCSAPGYKDISRTGSKWIFGVTH